VAKGAIIIQWGSVTRGREEKALENFAKAQAYWEELAKAGRIESSRVYIHNGGNLGQATGTQVLEGELATLQAILVEKRTTSLIFESNNVVENLNITLATGGSMDDVAESFGLYSQALSNQGFA